MGRSGGKTASSLEKFSVNFKYNKKWYYLLLFLQHRYFREKSNSSTLPSLQICNLQCPKKNILANFTSTGLYNLGASSVIVTLSQFLFTF
jgi:hypothetical protein